MSYGYIAYSKIVLMRMRVYSQYIYQIQIQSRLSKGMIRLIADYNFFIW